MSKRCMLVIDEVEGMPEMRRTLFLEQDTLDGIIARAKEIVKGAQAEKVSEFPFAPPIVRGKLYSVDLITEIDGGQFIRPKGGIKILIVDDEEVIQRKYGLHLNKDAPTIKILAARTIEEGWEFFQTNSDISLIVVDACVPGDKPNTITLVEKMRKTFTGPIIAASNNDKYCDLLMRSGCSHKVNHYGGKLDLPHKVREVLGL